MTQPILLDLFCKAGGAGMGYSRAGFEVIGIDCEQQPRYPFAFFQMDWAEGLRRFGPAADVIHASPPCQAYSQATFCRVQRRQHPDLVGPVRDALMGCGRPWVIENVMRAPLGVSCVLCGLMFGLKVFRHRAFESSHLILSPPHPTHKGKKIGVGGMVSVAGHGDASRRNRISIPPDHRNKASWERGMGIDWMTRNELAQAIPPAFTEYVGRILTQVIAGA